MPFCLVPEVFYAVDVITLINEFFGMIDPEMLKF
jgi:hypothetical protein